MNNIKHLSAAIAATLIGAVATPAFAVPTLFEYKEATSSYEDAYVTGNFNVGSGNQDQSNYNLDLSLDYEKVFSSPDRNTKLDFTGSGSRSRGSNEGDTTKSDFQMLGSATMDNYFQPGSKGSFWYGKGEVGAIKGQDKPFTKATVGVGYGRVVNVTPMARAIRIVEELRKQGTVTSDPSNAAYQAIANVIAKEAEYSSKHGSKDYQQFWIADIENALQAAGVVKGGALGARSTIKSYDVLVNENISTRKHGWLVRAGLGAVLSDYDGETGKPALEVGAEYHLPLSNQTQFSNEAIFTTTLKDDDSSYIVNNEMSLTHELTDMIDWENKWLLNYNKTDGSESTTTNALTSAFNYELTNQLDFNVTAALSKVNDNVDNNGNDDLDKRLTMGIKYRLK